VEITNNIYSLTSNVALFSLSLALYGHESLVAIHQTRLFRGHR